MDEFKNGSRRCVAALFFLLWLVASTAYALPSVAFYYGNENITDKLRWFDVVVVDPGSGFDPRSYQSNESTALAYLSVGELDSNDQKIISSNKKWVIGKNQIWNSWIVDVSNPSYQNYVMQEKVEKLWKLGYRGFFLDTLDSYQLVSHDKAFVDRQVNGMISLIQAIKTAHPEAKIILNRGFEFIPHVREAIYAVAAESLFASWDQRHQRYVGVSESDRTALLTQLNRVKQMNIPIISIEYLPATQPKQAQEVIAKINQLGFIPWVTNGDLTSVKLMSPVTLPRKILVVVNPPRKGYLHNHDSLANLAMPLEYFGYLPVFHDVRDPLPELDSNDFAGIAMWLDRQYPQKTDRLYPWLIQNKNKHIPIVFFNSFGFAPTNNKLNAFGLSTKALSSKTHSVEVVHQHSDIGYESKITPIPEDFFPLKLKQGTSWVTLKDPLGNVGDMVGITPWGGYAMYPYVFTSFGVGEGRMMRWVVNPFHFLQQAFQFPVRPIPDTTTENGNRIMMVHVDGDGFVNKGEWRHGDFAGKELLDHVFSHYQVPTSVSVIQGEVAENGLYPKDSKRLESIARDIFKLPWVEIASHTFSHPFDWQLRPSDFDSLAHRKSNDPYNMPIPNYQFDYKKELIGSIDYINQRLAPPDKTCKLLFWSGDANPSKMQLQLLNQYGIKNMNGGDTSMSNEANTITKVSSLGIRQGSYYQTFAPIQNDYIFTDEWTAPFYGYIKVIDTFKLTESPRRLKPIDLYYHMYAGSKLASLSALKKVYDWALSQPVINVFASEYIDLVQDFNNISMTRHNGGWLIRNAGKLREFRIPKATGYPDLVNSKNVVGYQTRGDEHYIHLGQKTESYLKFSASPSNVPYLKMANAMVGEFNRSNRDMTFSLKGYMPIKLTMANMNQCQMEQNGKNVKPVSSQGGDEVFEFGKETQVAIEVKCS